MLTAPVWFWWFWRGLLKCAYSPPSPQGIWSTSGIHQIGKDFLISLHKQEIKGLGYVPGGVLELCFERSKEQKTYQIQSTFQHLQGNHLQKKLLFQPLLLQVLCGVYRDLPTRLGPFRVEWLGIILDKVVATHVDQVQDF